MCLLGRRGVDCVLIGKERCGLCAYWEGEVYDVVMVPSHRYCPQCKTDVSEVVRAGEKLRMSKKKANMVSNKQKTNRDWGKVGP